MFFEELTATDCALIGRSIVAELTQDRRTLMALAGADKIRLILESAMDEPPNLEMVGAIALLCTRATVGAPDHDRQQALDFERLSGFANQFLNMVGEDT